MGEPSLIRELSRIVSAGMLVLSMTAPSAGSTAPTADVDGTLESYLSLAMRSSPALEAARARHEASKALVGRVGALPDPVVSYGHYFEEVETRVGPQVYRLGVRQRLPWFGKLSLAEDAARSRA